MHMTIDKQLLVFLLSSLALIVFPHFEHLPASIFGYYYFLLIWRFVGIWWVQWLPNRWVLALLMVFGIFLIFSQHQGIFGRDAGTRLFIVGLGLKLMEIKSKRDLFLVTYLAFIVAASQFLYEQSLFMGAYILLVCCLLLATLVMINGYKLSAVKALKTAGLILMQALPIAVALFVLFPRFEAPRWALFDEGGRARTGLSDSMEPGSISELGMSDELVFRVQFKNGLPPPAARYWRGPVLTFTDGRRWLQGETRSPVFLDEPRFSGKAYQYTLLMEPQNKSWVFGLDMPAEFPAQLGQTQDYRLLRGGNPDRRAEYSLVSYPEFNTGRISRLEYKETVQLPKQRSEKITELVKQLHGFEQPPAVFIQNVLNHFRQEKFYYTLTPPLLSGENPLEAFLFTSRHGFCSHYAAAFVYMMRLAEIPARVVTGYQGGEWNSVGGFLEIRQADAHAWAEVWLENRGWVRVDPTAAIAPERIEQSIDVGGLSSEGAIRFALPDNGAVSWLKQTQQLWGKVDYSWQRWVINYNNKNQGDFLASLGIMDIAAMMRWLLAIVGTVVMVITVVMLWPKPMQRDAACLVYGRFTKKLAKYGVLKADTEGESDFAVRAAGQLPDRAEEIQQITDAFVRLRYGREADAAAIKELSRLVSAFRVKH